MDRKFKVAFIFNMNDNIFPAGEEIECDSASEAFIRAIIVLKTAINGDMIEAVRDGSATLVHFIEDTSLQVRITPGIIAEGHEKIGPYSFQYGMMMSDFPES